MKNLCLVIPLVLLLCFSFACQQGEEIAEKPAVELEAEAQAVQEAFWKFNNVGISKDMEQMKSTLADDVHASGTGDKQAIIENYSEWFSNGNYWDNTTINRIEVSSSADMAYVNCSWEFFRDEEGEKVSTGKGSNNVIFKKQTDGSWKIVAF